MAIAFLDFRLHAPILLLATVTLSLGAGADQAVPPVIKPTALELQRESLKKQQDSLKQQTNFMGDHSSMDPEFFSPLPVLAFQPDCPALDNDEIEKLIASAAQKQSLKPDLLRAVIRQESGFKPCAVSYKGAQGLMQLMPATAAQLHVADPFDPDQNVQAGAAFLKQLLKRYNGDLRLALIAYNAGATRADQPFQPYPIETQNYVASIFADLGLNEAGLPEEPAAESAPQD